MIGYPRSHYFGGAAYKLNMMRLIQLNSWQDFQLNLLTDEYNEKKQSNLSINNSQLLHYTIEQSSCPSVKRFAKENSRGDPRGLERNVI